MSEFYIASNFQKPIKVVFIDNQLNPNPFSIMFIRSSDFLHSFPSVFFPIVAFMAGLASIPNVFGQVHHGGQPEWQIDISTIPALRLPEIDRELLDAQDAVTDQYKEAPWRFGVEFEVNVDPL
ncbi:MAG: hypothetical protein ISQ97_06970, partial [Flavobacteriales bacterium]|nr:hypothetical protein [Flavobacteriales bacterium]